MVTARCLAQQAGTSHCRLRIGSAVSLDTWYGSMGRYVAWPPSEELVALLARAQQGDSRARDDLLTALRPPLLAFFCYRFPEDAAEDLAQIALIRIARAIPRIDPVRADRYVATVARNLLRSAFRRHAEAGRRFVGEFGIDRAASRQAVELDLEYRELAGAVQRASATSLPPPLARIVLGLLRGESTAEIAAEQRVSPITIRTRLLRARATLRRELRMFLERQDGGDAPASAGERFRRCRGM